MKQSDKEQSEPTEKQIALQSGFFVRKKHPPSKKKVKVNTSHCRGELRLIKNIIKQNGWVQVFKGGDIMWSGLALPVDEHELATQMFVNRLPAMPHLCHKRTLGFILNKFREYWPEHFWFYPRTYLLPQDTQQLQEKLKKGGVFIAKPSAGCQGDGIALIKKLSQIPKIGNQQWIVQPYIDKPLLINKKKFDFRLYVLISSLEPYICYLNQEGLARFCTQDYQAPSKQNFNNPFIHLTNYSLNKNHPNFENGGDAFSKGGKRCLKVVWDELVQSGVDVTSMRAKIQELTQKFLTGIYPFLKYYYRSVFPKKNGKCFHVIGIDILIDEELNPWLLESNNNPSFNIEHEAIIGNQTKKQVSPVDQYVKSIVVEDSLYLVRRSLSKQRDMEVGDHYYSWKKILDVESQELKEMNIVENMLRIFHSYCGVRSKQVLTASQFTKLSNLSGMTSEKITRNDYHLIFIKIMRTRFNQNQMNFEDFIDAMQYLVKQLVGFGEQDKLNVMQGFIDSLIAQLPQEK